MTSIILPSAYDRGSYQEALESARAQTAACEIIKVSQTQSLSKNINEGLKLAKGEFVKILPDDDLLTPDCIEILESAIGDNDFIFANAINFDGQNQWEQKPLNSPVTLEKMLQRNQIHGGTILYRTDVLRKVGGFDESLWIGEEYELSLRLMALGYTWTYVDKVVFKYRMHPTQKSKGRGVDQNKRKVEIKKIQDRWRK